MNTFRWKLFIVLMFSALYLSPEISHSKDDILVSSGNHNYPPSSWREDDQIVGVAADLLRLIFDELGVKVQSPYKGPWKRVQKFAEDGKIDILTTLYKNTEREAYLDFPSEPYMDDSNVIWVKKGKKFPFEKWGDLFEKTGGIVLGDSFGKKFDKFMKQLNIEQVLNIDQNFKKLSVGRLDYVPAGLYSGTMSIKRLGFENELEYLQKPLLSEGLYIAVSKKSKYRKYLPEIEKAIRKYKDDGTIEHLIQKNMEQYIKRQSPSD